MRTLAILATALLIAGCGDKQQEESRAARAAYDKDIAAKVASGPYIERTKKLSDDEEFSVVTIPDSLGVPELFQRCFIYKNHQLKTSNMQCPSGISVSE